jgi:hypothetical protein
MSKEIKGKDPAFLFYPGQYLQDTQTLSEKSQVAYDRIMCEHMRNICISQQQLKFFTKRLTDDEIEELMFVLTEVEGGYQVGWVAESIYKRRAYSESRSKNRASKPKKDMSNISKTYVEHMVNENEIVNENINKDGNVSEYEIIEYPAFSDFWDMYDKKRGDVGKIKSKWSKLTQSEKEAIIDYLPAYIANTADKKFRKDPLTFLNNKSWNDEIITENKPGRKPIAKLEISDFD